MASDINPDFSFNIDAPDNNTEQAAWEFSGVLLLSEAT
jgi:hypothetical protein